MGVEGSRPPIRIVVADDDTSIHEYVRVALACEGPEFDVVGVAPDAGTAVDQVMLLEPDVLILDLEMPAGGGLRAAQIVSSIGPGTKVVVFTSDADGEGLLPLLRAGVCGYLPKTATSAALAAMVRAAADGNTTLTPELTGKAVTELTARLHAERSQELRIEQARRRIERVVRDQAFTIVLQPVVQLRTRSVAMVEALTRFTGGTDGSPARWFAEAALASRTCELELATASAALGLLDVLDERLAITINLSPSTVLSGRLPFLLGSVDTSRVVLELTEHAAVDDYGFLNMTLQRWREAGVRIAVDDAGAGYASFSHVVDTRPDFIKLDLSLTRNIATDPSRQALARALVGFAREVGIEVIAEGIETPADLRAIEEIGTGFGQGFHLGRPLPLESQPALARGATMGR